MSPLYIITEDAQEDFEEEIMLDYFFACPNVGELVKVYSDEGHLFSGVVRSVEFRCDATDPLDSEVTLVLKKSRKRRGLSFYHAGDGDGNHPAFREEWSIAEGGDHLVLTFYKDNYTSVLGQTLTNFPPAVDWTIAFQNEHARVQGKVIERVWLIHSEDWDSWEIAVLLDDGVTG
ncbi:MAG: hypothetical protein WHV44_15250 [Anaerolineales bacterium]